jgi:hypothetical protein
MFRTDQISVVKLVAPIRGAVSALFGKNSVEMQQIDVLADKIRGNKLIRIAATDTVDEHTISQSEKSYGSSTQYFKDLVTTLQTFPTYDPSRVELKVANLLTFIGQLDALNSQANTSFQLMKAAKATRRDIYTELNDRTQRIKSYVKSQYGTSSQEFILIKGIKI